MGPTTDPNRVIIFDTTLRDGEQSPGCSMNLGEKLEMARALADLGVDVIEAGFPIASPGDFESVQAIAREVHGPIICGLARCNPADIDRAADAVKDAPAPRIHVFLATSAIHREFKLRMIAGGSRRTGPSRASSAPASVATDVEFSPEDAARTELDFLAEVVEKAIEAGATTLNIPDTVGYAVPSHYASIIRHLKKHVRGIDNVRAVGPLPQRPRPGRREQPRGAGRRRPAGRMHDQRHRRAGRQHFARRSRDGPQHAARFLRPDHRHQHPAPLPRQPQAVARHRHAGAAEQGDRRPERLRARGRHPPGRHAQGTQHLRDHEAGGRRHPAHGTGARQAQRPARPQAARRRTSAIT